MFIFWKISDFFKNNFCIQPEIICVCVLENISVCLFSNICVSLLENICVYVLKISVFVC